MTRQGETLALLGQIYDAAFDASKWPSVLSSLARAFNGQTASFFQQDFTTGAGRPLAFHDLAVASFHEYAAYYWTQDLWSLHPRRHAVGKAYLSHQHIADADLLCTEFYNDFMRPNRLFYAIGCLPLIEGRRLYMLGLHRPKPRGRPFTRGQREQLQRLVPHIRRALQIHHRLEEATVERDAFREAADHLPRGIFTFDGQGRLLWANPVGEELCRQADGLTITRGLLTAALAAETRRLHQLVREAVEAAHGTVLADSGATLISRPSGRRPYVAFASPVRAGPRPIDDHRPTAALFVTDPARTPELPLERLMRLYGLTGTEAQLARHIASGRSLQDIASSSSRTMNTVRTQLKQVFQKTGTSRQAQLVRLLLQTEGIAQERVRRHLRPAPFGSSTNGA
jgi:DNA-binding CsgD family transcriptional regulator